MDIQSLTFGIKDVIAIIGGVGTIVGTYFAMKRSNERIEEKNTEQDEKLSTLKAEMEEKFLHAKNAKKANIESIMASIKEVETNTEKKETNIYTRITEIRTEQKDDHSKLSSKIDTITLTIGQMNQSLAELLGYVKATGKKRS